MRQLISIIIAMCNIMFLGEVIAKVKIDNPESQYVSSIQEHQPTFINPNDTCNIDLPTLNIETGAVQSCITLSTLNATNDLNRCSVSGVSIWQTFSTDSLATVGNVFINHPGFLQIFEGSCENPITNKCTSNFSTFNFPVRPNTKYIVKIDVEAVIENVEICVKTTSVLAPCYTINVLSITRPENPTLGPNFPLVPGEKVKICLNVDFTTLFGHAPGNNCQVLQGIIPSLGDGWDYQASSIASQTPEYTFWLPEGQVDYNVYNPLLKVETGLDGFKRIGIGTEKEFLNKGTLLPGGYWLPLNDSLFGCANDNDPDNGWVNNLSGCELLGGYMLTIPVCLNLKVKSYQDLIDHNISNVSFSIAAFANGEIGCKSERSCAGALQSVYINSINVNSDLDFDGIIDGLDNCPKIENADQLDANSDGEGNVCDNDSDSDNDGIIDNIDNCPDKNNPNQSDSDNNDIGDVCDLRNYHLKGICYTDTNLNNIYDPSKDFPLPNVAINVIGNSNTFYTNQDGYYDIMIDSGLQVVNYQINFGQWQSNLIQKSINAMAPLIFAFVGFKPSSNSLVSAITSINTTTLECEQTENLYAQVFNDGSILLDGYLYVTYDPKTILVYTNPLPSGSDENTIIWSFDKLPPGKIFSPEIKVIVPDDSLTDSLVFISKVFNSFDNMLLDSFNSNEEINCSGKKIISNNWPNRIGEDNYTLLNEDLSYQVKFQNTSSTVANTVKIINVIDTAFLDINSLIIQKLSHSFDVWSTGNQVIFYADSLDLKGNRDGENEVYINFKLKQRPNLLDKTIIRHSANYVFDNDLKESSNTIINTIVSQLPCDLINDEIILLNNELSVKSNGEKITWYNFITNTEVGNGAIYKPEITGKYYCVIEGNNCKTITSPIDFIISSTYEKSTSKIVIFPNPTNGIVNIVSNLGKIKTTVTDIFGKVILRTEETVIDLNSNSKSIYFLMVEKEGETKVFKVIKL
jgi:hypothetical protein